MKEDETPLFVIKGLFKKPAPALLEIETVKKKLSKSQKLTRLMTLEEGMECVLEAVENDK